MWLDIYTSREWMYVTESLCCPLEKLHNIVNWLYTRQNKTLKESSHRSVVQWMLYTTLRGALSILTQVFKESFYMSEPCGHRLNWNSLSSPEGVSLDLVWETSQKGEKSWLYIILNIVHWVDKENQTFSKITNSQ